MTEVTLPLWVLLLFGVAVLVGFTMFAARMSKLYMAISIYCTVIANMLTDSDRALEWARAGRAQVDRLGLWLTREDAEVAHADGRYLMHRAGGGTEGGEGPMSWDALSMLAAGARLAEEQIWEQTRPTSDEDEGDG